MFTMKRRQKVEKVCKCGCNKTFITTHPRKVFKNDACRKRYGRKQPDSIKTYTGYIYLISDGEYTKIGKALNPFFRLQAHQISNPRKLQLLFYKESLMYSLEEKRLKDKYRNKKKNGEWFDLSQEDIEDIKRLVDGDI